MMRQFLEYLRFKIWAPWRMNHFSSFYSSHSQFGEDMILRYLFGEEKKGFYVDIGAHHPVFISNTYHFYLKGWHGLCVDASAQAIAAFRSIRPRDISVVACLGDDTQTNVAYYQFDQPALNTSDSEQAEQIIQSGRAQLLNKSVVKTWSLNELLSKYIPSNTEIDFLTMDIEGVDEALILAQDWNKSRPKAIVFESQGKAWNKISSLACVNHLESAGYSLEAKCGHSIIMVRST